MLHGKQQCNARYNAGCGLAAIGDYEEAETELKENVNQLIYPGLYIGHFVHFQTN